MQKDIILRPNWDQLRKMQAQGLLLEIDPATLYQYSKSVLFDIPKLHFYETLTME